MRLSPILGLVALSGIGTAVTPDVSAQSFRTVAQARQRTSEDRLNVTVKFAVGTLRLFADGTGALYRSQMTYDENLFRPETEYQGESNRLSIDLNGSHNRRNINYPKGTKQRLELALSPDVPAYLDLTFGAGEADIDLGGLSLVEGEFNTGASESRVRFSRPNKVACRELAFHVGATDFRATGLGNARCDKITLMGGAGDLTLDFTGDWGTVTRTAAEIGVGVGSVTLRLPESLGVAIRIERFLSSFDQTGFVKRGNTYYSASYDSAPTRLDLEIKAALGAIDVVWVK